MRLKTGREMPCRYCGELFYVPGWAITKRYCSLACRNQGVKGSNFSSLTQFKKGQTPWNKGKEYSQISWDKHPNFRGGEKSYVHHLKQVGVLPICNRCGIEGEYGRKIHIHHKDRNRFNNSLENLEVICSKCHAHEHKNWEARWLVS